MNDFDGDVLYQAIVAHIPKNTPRLYIACSMGRDSLVLLTVCHRLFEQGLLPRPIGLHVHHHLQKVADVWADAFCCFCQKHAIDYKVLHAYPDPTETSARQARFAVMADVMMDGDVLLTAHHAFDQAETVLMRLIAGAGITGLAGMQPYNQKFVNDKTITIIRPFLGVSRDLISAYAKRHRLPYVDDPTNVDGSTRATLRKILPILKTINPSVIDNINRTATIAYDFKIIGADLYTQIFNKSVYFDSQYLSILTIDEICCLNLPTQRLFFHEFLGKNSHYAPPFGLVNQVIQLIHTSKTDHASQIYWAGTDSVIFRYHRHLFVLKKAIFEFLRHKKDYDLPVFFTINHASLIQTVNKDTKIGTNNKSLAGKKLYQTLKIPPIFRRLLVLCEYQGVRYLASYGIAWRLDSVDNGTQNLPCFDIESQLVDKMVNLG